MENRYDKTLIDYRNLRPQSSPMHLNRVYNEPPSYERSYIRKQPDPRRVYIPDRYIPNLSANGAFSIIRRSPPPRRPPQQARLYKPASQRDFGFEQSFKKERSRVPPMRCKSHKFYSTPISYRPPRIQESYYDRRKPIRNNN